MGYATLIKYALWALLIVACTWFVWHMAANVHDNIYNDGRMAERAEWQEKEADRANQLAHEIAEAVDRLSAERDKQINELTGALDHANQAQEKLNRDLNTVRTANRGLWIDAQNCANGTDEAARETESTSIGGSGTERIRLPGQIEQNLWELVADAQRVVIQYKTLLQTCLPLVDVMEDPG